VLALASSFLVYVYQGGVIAVGGNSKYDANLNLYSLAMRNQSILGVHRGSRRQLQDLVNLVASGQVGLDFVV